MHARTLALASSFIAMALAVFPAGAAAKVAVRDSAVPGYTAPGSPAKYNRVFVRKYGPSDAKKVLVLVPGTLAGASTFDIVAPQLVERVPGLQVWAQDRRESALEDPSLLAKVRAGTATPAQARDYYLGWLANPAIAPHYQPLTNAQTAFGRTWGLRVALEDLRRVVLRASGGGKRTVILGGHSLGGGIAALYATWDFDGTPGYRDIDGIVGIDGGMSRSSTPITLAQAKAQLAELDTKGPLDGPSRARAAVGGRRVRRGRRRGRVHRSEGRVGLRRLPAAARAVQAPGPRDQPGRPGLRLRSQDLARDARAHPHPLGLAVGDGAAPRLGRQRDHADPQPRHRILEPEAHGRELVLPQPPEHRRARRAFPAGRRRLEASRAARHAPKRRRRPVLRVPGGAVRPRGRAGQGRAGLQEAVTDPEREDRRSQGDVLAPRPAPGGVRTQRPRLDARPVAEGDHAPWEVTRSDLRFGMLDENGQPIEAAPVLLAH